MALSLKIPFENSYSGLPERFYAKQTPEPVKAPSMIKLNGPLAEALGIDPGALAGPGGVEALAGNRVPEGADPLAMAYAGHQFGHFVPQLGDGRAILLGEVIDSRGERQDIQLKGSGRTPFSRSGDGRAWIGPVIREYILSEAMHALGVPTTRALAAVRTGETVFREAPLPGAIVTRVATSHLRVGTFQYFAARQDTEAVRILADYAIARHYPEAEQAEEPYRAFLEAVCRRQAQLIAKWLQLGFIHGVMNTDNMAISGQTIDYGPCAFMDEFHSGKTFSSIDRHGRYAYDQQPQIAQWNLARLAETLLPLLDPEEETAIEIANAVVGDFGNIFQKEYLNAMRGKFGLFSGEEEDLDLIGDFLSILQSCEADFTLSFRTLGKLIENLESDEAGALVRSLGDDSAWGPWKTRWLERIDRQPQSRSEAVDRMKAHNPAVIPRNHLVERAIQDALGGDDSRFMDQMIEALAMPYADPPKASIWTIPPRPEERVAETFCGT
ncbi:MAG TPA: YdiU family protein [Opitutales bacterium]|nr:YdiU family protein [Opitutales bacterium]